MCRGGGQPGDWPPWVPVLRPATERSERTLTSLGAHLYATWVSESEYLFLNSPVMQIRKHAWILQPERAVSRTGRGAQAGLGRICVSAGRRGPARSSQSPSEIYSRLTDHTPLCWVTAEVAPNLMVLRQAQGPAPTERGLGHVGDSSQYLKDTDSGTRLPWFKFPTHPPELPLKASTFPCLSFPVCAVDTTWLGVRANGSMYMGLSYGVWPSGCAYQ